MRTRGNASGLLKIKFAKTNFVKGYLKSLLLSVHAAPKLLQQ